MELDYIFACLIVIGVLLLALLLVVYLQGRRQFFQWVRLLTLVANLENWCDTISYQMSRSSRKSDDDATGAAKSGTPS